MAKNIGRTESKVRGTFFRKLLIISLATILVTVVAFSMSFMSKHSINSQQYSAEKYDLERIGFADGQVDNGAHGNI